MKERNLFSIALWTTVVVGALSTTGCSPEPATPLRIGTNAWPGYEIIHLAQEKGYYRDEGVDVRLIEFSSLSDARRAFERGQLDGFATTVIEVLQARDQSARAPQVMYVFDNSDGADVILARPERALGAKLRGAKIGVELGSLGVYVLARGLAKYGLTINDVKAISTDQLTMVEQLRKGELDAIVTYPPTSITVQHDTPLTPIFSSADIPGEIIDVLAIDKEVSAQRRSDVSKFVRALHRASDFTAQHQTEAYDIMAKHEGISREEFGHALNDGIKVLSPMEQVSFFGPNGKLTAVVEASDRVLRDTGQVKGPDRCADVVDGSYTLTVAH